MISGFHEFSLYFSFRFVLSLSILIFFRIVLVMVCFRHSSTAEIQKEVEKLIPQNLSEKNTTNMFLQILNSAL